MAPPQQIVVEPMTQQLLVQKAGEDWTGVTSTAERRKLQNRLNKRSQYLRKRQKLEKPRIAARADLQATSNTPEDTTLQRSPNAMMQAIIETCEIFESPDISQRVFALASMAYLDYVMNAPRISQLPILITLNVNIAIAKNATLMGFDRERMCMDEAISPFNQNGPWPSFYNPPKALEPTSVQKTVLHHPWLDIFPFPKFRDNAILAADAALLDDGELCEDIAEVNLMNTERPSLIVWGDASIPHSWEASPLFLWKWAVFQQLATVVWPNGKASDYESEDSGFDPQHDHIFALGDPVTSLVSVSLFFLVWEESYNHGTALHASLSRVVA
ncbi:hypothetical protein FPOAC1_009797 [Fusarium poae]|uniref:hypothetical protein n=1 Tax=Fusarium poae TaxID=36050 RepID=UPI001CE92F37|nr:hypothetical protein FPOAC1_009797 [Fusarium poae]KAG8670388.1 hypothetical protein FPOAC1_009797 [Fusarium poae]